MASFDEIYGRNYRSASTVPLGSIGRKNYVAVLAKDGPQPLYNIVIIDGGNQFTHVKNMSLAGCQSAFKGWSRDGDLIRKKTSNNSDSSFGGFGAILLIIAAVIYASLHGAHFP